MSHLSFWRTSHAIAYINDSIRIPWSNSFHLQEIVYITSQIVPETISWTSLLLHTGRIFGFLYQSLTVLLFCCTTWMASTMLKCLIDQFQIEQIGSHVEVNRKLLRGGRTFALIKGYIEQINSIFGVTLLIAVLKDGFLINLFIYRVMKMLREPQDLVFLTLIIIRLSRNSLHFTIIILSCHCIGQKVNIVYSASIIDIR